MNFKIITSEEKKNGKKNETNKLLEMNITR